MSAQHTPVECRRLTGIGCEVLRVNADGKMLASLDVPYGGYTGHTQESARDVVDAIVHAVNSHDALVEALGDLIDYCDPNGSLDGAEMPVLRKACEVLAKARGEEETDGE